MEPDVEFLQVTYVLYFWGLLAIIWCNCVLCDYNVQRKVPRFPFIHWSARFSRLISTKICMFSTC